jgi:hypothetical protein
VAKRAAIMVGRYIHAHQFKRARRALKFLHTRVKKKGFDTLMIVKSRSQSPAA